MAQRDTSPTKDSEDDDEDTFGELIGCQTILRQHHHRLLFPHRNSLHISGSAGLSLPGIKLTGRQFLGPPDKYDKKLRRLSDPGGGGLGSLRLDDAGRVRSPSGKLCDPRLEVIRSLSPSKISQAAGEEGEALATPLLATRSSRSKSVFQLPCGLNTRGLEGRSRSMSVSIQSFGDGKASTPTKTRPDSPTPPSCFYEQPLLLRPQPFHLNPIPPFDYHRHHLLRQQLDPLTPLIRIDDPSRHILLERPEHDDEDFYSDPTSPPPDYHNPSALFRRRRSISLEGSRLESIIEENSKPSRKCLYRISTTTPELIRKLGSNGPISPLKLGCRFKNKKHFLTLCKITRRQSYFNIEQFDIELLNSCSPPRTLRKHNKN